MGSREEKEKELRKVEEAVMRCNLCGLHKSRTLAVPGEGPVDAKVMIIGEGPGEEEDKQGRPFVGRAGRFLNNMLEEAGLRRSEVFITNVVKCFVEPYVMVYTVRGYKPISKVSMGDLVLTHKGRFKRVVYVRPADKLPKGSKVVKMRVKRSGGGLTSLTVTPEHPFLANGVWKQAAEIECGDRVAILDDYASLTKLDRIFNEEHNADLIRYERSLLSSDSYRLVNDALDTDRALIDDPTAHLLNSLGSALVKDREKNIKAISLVRIALDSIKVRYVDNFSFRSKLSFSFYIPDNRILIDVGDEEREEISLVKRSVAKTHGFFLIKLNASKVIDNPNKLIIFFKTFFSNIVKPYHFEDACIVEKEVLRTDKDYKLYNIGVEDDESYVAQGLVSHNCRPPGNRAPTDEESSTCISNYLVKQLEIVNPKVVCLLGNTAVKALLGKGSVSKLRGREVRVKGRVYFCTYHPAAALYNAKLAPLITKDMKKLKGIVEVMEKKKGKEARLDSYI